jgi:hypothetical protein
MPKNLTERKEVIHYNLTERKEVIHYSYSETLINIPISRLSFMVDLF